MLGGLFHLLSIIKSLLDFACFMSLFVYMCMNSKLDNKDCLQMMKIMFLWIKIGLEVQINSEIL